MGAENNPCCEISALVHYVEAVLSLIKKCTFPLKDNVQGGGLKSRVFTTAG